MPDTELPAGPELDARIARAVMGAQLIDYRWYDGTSRPFLWWPDMDPPRGDDFQRLPNGWLCEWNSIPRYSTSIAAAWEIVEYLRTTRGAHWELIAIPLGMIAMVLWEGDGTLVRQMAASMPLAICRAALTALQSA